jgi:hypothetical protein
MHDQPLARIHGRLHQTNPSWTGCGCITETSYEHMSLSLRNVAKQSLRGVVLGLGHLE